jgi:CheY-like chemotaxis protein
MKVLIVDDNLEAAEILADGARLAGCEAVETVDSGEDAIGKAILVDYDIITLDIRMPGVSGLDALSVVRGLRPHAILAIVSAYTRDMDPDALTAADVVLSKPVSIERFQDVLKLTQEIADRRQAIRELGVTV